MNKKIPAFSTILAAFAIAAGSVWFAPAAAADLNRGARAYAAGDFAAAAASACLALPSDTAAA